MPPWSLRHGRELVQGRLLRLKRAIKAKIERSKRTKQRQEKRAQRRREIKQAQEGVRLRTVAAERANLLKAQRDANYAPGGKMERLGHRRQEYENGEWGYPKGDWEPIK